MRRWSWTSPDTEALTPTSHSLSVASAIVEAWTRSPSSSDSPLGLALGVLIGALWMRSRPAATEGAVAAIEKRAADQAVVQDGLDRLQDQLSDLAHDRVAWQAQLNEQVAGMRHSTDTLRRETSTLATALRKPQVRGQWGELHLRRTVELAGLVDHCDFAEQVRFDDGRLRPDLVVSPRRRPHDRGRRQGPLDAYLDAAGTDDPAEHDRALQRLGEHVRKHIDDLGSRRYWRALPQTPEFVVLFVPGEAILQAALQAVPDLSSTPRQRTSCSPPRRR